MSKSFAIVTRASSGNGRWKTILDFFDRTLQPD